jgi:hypothetical protein
LAWSQISHVTKDKDLEVKIILREDLRKKSSGAKNTISGCFELGKL